jgi:O-glycosyl hydrolase
VLGRCIGGLGLLAAGAVLLGSAPARAAGSPWNVEVVQTAAGLGQRLARLPDLRLTAAPPATCARSQLRLSAGNAPATSARYAQTVVITNASRSSCSLRGYPALALLDRRGRPLRVRERDGDGALFEDHGRQPTTLAAGGTASFAFGGHSKQSGRPCPSSRSIAVALPGVPGSLEIPVSAPACRSGIVLSAVGLGPDSAAYGPPPPAVAVDARVRYQRVVGVGAAMTDSSAWLIYDGLSPGARRRLIDRLFGARGIRLPFTLVPIGASDFTAEGVPYTYDDMPAGQSDPDLRAFSIAHDQAYVLPALAAVLAADPSERILAVPWTAPAWMKANDALDDLGYRGTLLPADYGAFAQYFVRFLQAYAAAGVPVAAIAPENEPDAPSAFPAMSLPEGAESQWLAEYLKPALQQAGLRPQIYGYDGGWRSPAYPEALAASPAGADLAGIAWHCYSGVPTVMDALHARSPALAQIVTECSPGISPYNASELMIGAFRHWATTATLWNLALDPAGGPVQPPNSGCHGCSGVVTIDRASGRVTYNAAYYQLGQLSRFVLPGARRIASQSFAGYYRAGSSNRIGPGLADVAFRNPDGSIVLLAYNDTHGALGFTLRWAGRWLQYVLPAGATTTLVWNRR